MRTETIELAADGVAATPAVEQAAAAVVAAVAELARVASGSGSLGEWLAVVGACQAGMNRLAAVQDVAIAQAARVESVWREDGTLGEVVHGPGRVALDAADVVAPLLGASHHRAQVRVEEAVRVTGWDPVPLDVKAAPQRTGLEGLHAAMRDGRLDGYRASVVAFELSEAPAGVADAVVAALEPYLVAEPAPRLRQRTRRLLARISPDLLRQRAARARAETGLRRWVSEPGVDTWHGTFPSEDSATAWAAVDALARRYVTEKVCATIEQARGKALTDLVTQQADVSVTVQLTVPAATETPDAGNPDRPGHADGGGDLDGGSALIGGDASAEPGKASAPVARALRVPGSGEDLVAASGSRPGEPVLVPAAWLAAHTGDLATVVACDPGTGARLDPDERHSTESYRPGTGLVALLRARDGRCRFPGCSVAARFCDLDHVRPWPAGRTEASNLLCLCRRHHRIKQAPGWRVRLHPDGRAEWTDPTGRVAVTEPLDALEVLVLHPDPDAEVAAPVWRVGEPEPGQLPSALEDTLDHQFQQLEVRAAAWREHRHRRGRQRGGARDQWDHADVRGGIDRHPPWRDARGRPATLGAWVLDGHHNRRRLRSATPDEPPF